MIIVNKGASKLASFILQFEQLQKNIVFTFF